MPFVAPKPRYAPINAVPAETGLGEARTSVEVELVSHEDGELDSAPLSTKWRSFGRRGPSTTNARLDPGWRPTILAWTLVVLSVLIINVTVLVWSSVKTPPQLPPTAPGSMPRGTSSILYMGDCQTVSRYKLWIHLAINALSSLLLIASANCMQCLGSPTREELNRAHANGNFLDISILSSKNMLYISKKRTALCIVLALSSMPLHLLYNSVIYTTLGARDISTFIASQDYIEDSTLNMSTITSSILGGPSWVSELPPDANQTITGQAQSLMPKSTSYQGVTLNAADCISQFSNPVVSTYDAVTIVLNVTASAQILYWGETLGNGLKQLWTCLTADGGPTSSYTNASEIMSACGTCKLLAGEYLASSGICVRGVQGNLMEASVDFVLPANGAWHVTSCEAKPAPDYCGLELAPQILTYVVAANAVKLVAMLSTIFFMKFEPIVTVGDAVRTYLSDPDRATVGAGLISNKAITKNQLPREKDSQSTRWDLVAGKCPIDRKAPWQDRRIRYGGCISVLRWIVVLGFCLAIEITAAGLLISSLGGAGDKDTGFLFAESKASGLGAVNPLFLTPIENNDMTSLSLIANAPQIMVSIAYILYYSLFSSMLAAVETAAMATKRKSLRVSAPQRGAQRGSYWLTIPMRFSLPLLVAMGGLHYLISQSIFIVRLNQVASGPLTPGGKDQVTWGFLNGFGFSPIAIIASMSLGFAMILAPVLLGLRRFPSGMPVLGNNSLAIAAACHPDPNDPDNIAELPLMYGVLPTLGKTGKRRVGFSSSIVEPLQNGEVYDRTLCSHTLRNPRTKHLCGRRDREWK